MQTSEIYSAGQNPPADNLNSTNILSLAMTALRLTTGNFNGNYFKNQTENKIITLEEVTWHDHLNDCWIVLYDRVYNITKFVHEHPGGSDVLLEHAGRDATIAFRGSGHSKSAIAAMKCYHIGDLPVHERLFRKPGGIKLRDIPD